MIAALGSSPLSLKALAVGVMIGICRNYCNVSIMTKFRIGLSHVWFDSSLLFSNS